MDNYTNNSESDASLNASLLNYPSITENRASESSDTEVNSIASEISQYRIAEIEETMQYTETKTKSSSPTISEVREKFSGLKTNFKRPSGAAKRRRQFLIKQGYSLEEAKQISIYKIRDRPMDVAIKRARSDDSTPQKHVKKRRNPDVEGEISQGTNRKEQVPSYSDATAAYTVAIIHRDYPNTLIQTE